MFVMSCVCVWWVWRNPRFISVIIFQLSLLVPPFRGFFFTVFIIPASRTWIMIQYLYIRTQHSSFVKMILCRIFYISIPWMLQTRIFTAWTTIWVFFVVTKLLPLHAFPMCESILYFIKCKLYFYWTKTICIYINI